MLIYDFNFYNINHKYYDEELLNEFIDDISLKIINLINNNNYDILNQIFDILKNQFLIIKLQNNKSDEENIKIAIKYFIHAFIFYKNIDGYEFINDNFNKIIEILYNDFNDILIQINNISINDFK
jgi:hypothetical protein